VSEGRSKKVTIQLGLRTESVHPRIHDLRHSFAVRTLIKWLRAGVDVGIGMSALSTYLGHVNPTKGSQTVFA
jgi:integrase